MKYVGDTEKPAKQLSDAQSVKQIEQAVRGFEAPQAQMISNGRGKGKGKCKG